MARKRKRTSKVTRIRRTVVKTIKAWFMILVTAILLFAAVMHLPGLVKRFWKTPSKTTQVSVSRNYNGIDISKFQGTINWQKVAQDKNIQFVYIKATEGATHYDKKYETNLQKARKAGLKVGSYHFFTYRKSAKEQFENFKKHVRKYEQDLIPMVDVEKTGNNGATREKLQKNLNEFMQLVKKEYGKYPLLYSQYHFYNKLLAPEFNRYYIYIARYSTQEPILQGGGKYNIWQYTEQGKIEGIDEYVDLARFGNGTTLTDILLR
jgi:lysozyme